MQHYIDPSKHFSSEKETSNGTIQILLLSHHLQSLPTPPALLILTLQEKLINSMEAALLAIRSIFKNKGIQQDSYLSIFSQFQEAGARDKPLTHEYTDVAKDRACTAQLPSASDRDLGNPVLCDV